MVIEMSPLRRRTNLHTSDRKYKVRTSKLLFQSVHEVCTCASPLVTTDCPWLPLSVPDCRLLRREPRVAVIERKPCTPRRPAGRGDAPRAEGVWRRTFTRGNCSVLRVLHVLQRPSPRPHHQPPPRRAGVSRPRSEQNADVAPRRGTLQRRGNFHTFIDSFIQFLFVSNDHQTTRGFTCRSPESIKKPKHSLVIGSLVGGSARHVFRRRECKRVVNEPLGHYSDALVRVMKE